MMTKEITNGLLKNKMADAMVNRGQCVDMDSCFQSGIYGVTPSTANIPSGVSQWGLLRVEVSNTYILHTYTTRSQPIVVLQRTMNVQGQDQYPWYIVATGQTL